VGNLSALERQLNVSQVEAQLNTLDISPPPNMRAWIRVWDSVKKYIGQVGQMYTYFQGYVRSPATVVPESLNDFAASVTESRLKDNSLEKVLAEFHTTVLAAAGSKASESEHLFSFLRKRLDEVRPAALSIKTWMLSGSLVGMDPIFFVPKQLFVSVNRYSIKEIL
jgi:hypothetical protein